MNKSVAYFELLLWGGLSVLIATHTNDIIVFALMTAYGDPASAPPGVMSKLGFVSPVFPLLLGILAFIRLKVGGVNISPLIGFSSNTARIDVAIGLIVGAISIAIAVVSLRVMSAYTPAPPFHLMPSSMHIYYASIGALIPGIFEELYFRGMMFRVARAVPKLLVLLFTATVFSLWHISAPIYLVHTFILGLLWGAVAWRTGRLAPSILAHCIANGGFGLLLFSGFKVIPTP